MNGIKQKKRTLVEWAMHYRQIVILVVCVLMVFGIYGLTEMKKNEFPDFTIRQGIVIAAYPGATAQQVEEEVTKPLEDYIFSYKEVKKKDTKSVSKDGLAVVQVELNDDLNNKDEFWSKFKHGISVFKQQLPSGVLAVQVQDDFGDTSALLIAMESEDKTYRELDDYMDDLKTRLRRVESVGRMTVYGMQEEQISVYVDYDRLSHYALTEQSLAMQLMAKGFATTAGKLKSADYEMPVYVGRSINTLRDVQEMIVFSDASGNVVRLKDIARVVREYPEPESVITNNGKKCLLLSVEMKKGMDIVQMGEAVKAELDGFQKTLPQEVGIYRITDQSKVVSDSIASFLKELLIAIAAVVIVVMLLLPFKVALVAASTIPITIFISLGLFYAFGIELNTVTLAALITTLGMIVDNSIVIIDSYMEKIAEGQSRWHASIESAVHFFKSILSATLAISITFFPFLFTMSGMVHDFLLSFPWGITLILLISLLVAELLVPFMQFFFIRKPSGKPIRKNGKKPFSFLDLLQRGYDRLLAWCFAHPKLVLLIGVLSVVGGCWQMGQLPQKMLPAADRNQFAVEIYMPTGTALEKTTAVADSLESVLSKDPRVQSVASFKGTSSPRFQNSYAPQMGGSNYAQFIVNTESNEATVAVLDEYTEQYACHFPEALIKFKQLEYSEAVSPVEIRLSGEDMGQLKTAAEEVAAMLREMPELYLVRTDLNEPLEGVKATLDEDASMRLGVTNAMLESSLALRYGKGLALGTLWEDDYGVDVVLKSTRSDSARVDDLQNERVAVVGGVADVPLRQVADLSPVWSDGQISRRNGVRTVTVLAEVCRGKHVSDAISKVQAEIGKMELPEGISLSYGGEVEETEDTMPGMIGGLSIAVALIFFILLSHFKRISTAVMLLSCLSLCLFGAAVGVMVQGVEFGVTCILGLISLMGILVRNGIIMIDYAEELRGEERMCVRDAIYHSAQRRMRPIFLTSAAASMGVIPMILGGSGLWMPMGTVIFYGTLITMFFILTVIPVLYWKVMARSDKYRKMSENMENE